MREYQIRYQGTVFWLARAETVIGRSRTATIVVDSRIASRCHACVKQRDGELYIVDLGSTNGTRVNGAMIRGELRLEPGDSIEIGAVCLSVDCIEEGARDDSEPTERQSLARHLKAPAQA